MYNLVQCKFDNLCFEIETTKQDSVSVFSFSFSLYGLAGFNLKNHNKCEWLRAASKSVVHQRDSYILIRENFLLEFSYVSFCIILNCHYFFINVNMVISFETIFFVWLRNKEAMSFVMKLTPRGWDTLYIHVLCY